MRWSRISNLATLRASSKQWRSSVRRILHQNLHRKLFASCSTGRWIDLMPIIRYGPQALISVRSFVTMMWSLYNSMPRLTRTQIHALCNSRRKIRTETSSAANSCTKCMAPGNQHMGGKRHAAHPWWGLALSKASHHPTKQILLSMHGYDFIASSPADSTDLCEMSIAKNYNEARPPNMSWHGTQII